MSVLLELKRRAAIGAFRDAVWGNAQDVYPVASAEAVARAESQLGFALPPLLRDIYRHVGNGGFGPGYGLLGVEGGETAHGQWNLVALYKAFRARTTRHEPWAERLLPICTGGCSYYYYLDCALTSAPVFLIDEDRHGHGPWGCDFCLLSPSFETWMKRWLDGDDLEKDNVLDGRTIFWFEENPQPA